MNNNNIAVASNMVEQPTKPAECVIHSDMLTVTVSSLGATLRNIVVATPKRKVDVALGATDSDFYKGRSLYMGATVGRCCNRIKQGKFCLNGKEYSLFCNNMGNHLHGGKVGFDKKVFDIVDRSDNSVTLYLLSPDGDQGYCGNLQLWVTYTVSGGRLSINYKAVCDQDTVFNPTNHSYFNLNGQEDGSVENHIVEIFADKYTPIDDTLIPTGELADVKGTPFDFTYPHAIGQKLYDNDHQLQLCGGYDHNYCVNGHGQVVAWVFSPKTGIKMEVNTDRCGMQFYSGQCLDGFQGKSVYGKHSAFCMETQCYPDAVNRVDFGQSPVLKAGEQFDSTTSYTFSYCPEIKV